MSIFSVPEDLRTVRLSTLPLSQKLASALARLKCSSLGDLQGVTIPQLQRTTPAFKEILFEVRGLIGLAEKWRSSKPNLRSPQAKKHVVQTRDVAQHASKKAVIKMIKIRSSPADSGKAGKTKFRTYTAAFVRRLGMITIPTELRTTPLQTLPLSVRLAHVLTHNGFKILGDLHSVPYLRVWKYRNFGARSLDELCNLVLACYKPRPPACLRSDTVPPTPRRLSVPSGVRQWSPYDLPMPSRLMNLLRTRGIARLGDLEGMAENELLACPYWSEDDLMQLRLVLDRVLAGEFGPGNGRPPRVPRPLAQVIPRFAVPDGAHDLNPFELPLSSRLTRLLQAMGIQRLGDLDGRPHSEFLKTRNCGNGTVASLVKLLERVAVGEFQPDNGRFDPADTGELLHVMDQVLLRLPSRKRKILRSWMGITTGRCLTLREVGMRFGCTRETMRHTIRYLRKVVQRAGGPGFVGNLRHLATHCSNHHCALEPALLSQWIAAVNARPSYPPEFYVRLLAWLNPDIPPSVNALPCFPRSSLAPPRRGEPRC